MTKAIWNGVVLAESDRCEVVDGNQYFPADALNMEYFKPSNTHTTCGWKGVASYYSVEVGICIVCHCVCMVLELGHAKVGFCVFGTRESLSNEAFSISVLLIG